MPVPPEALMKLLAGGGGKTAASGGNPIAAGAPGNLPPMGSPMTTPQPKEGATRAATMQVVTAMDVLERVLPEFGSETEEGRTLVRVLGMLGKTFGKQRAQSKDLMPAQLMALLSGMPKPTPEMGAARPPMPGATPGAGMPPPMAA